MKHSESRTISTSFVHAALRKVPLDKHERNSLLIQAKIPPEALTSPLSRISPAQFSVLIELLTEKTGDHSLGYFQRPDRGNLLATAARYSRDADDLLQAAQRVVELYNHFDLGFRLSLNERGNYIFYRMEPTGEALLDTWLCEQHLMVSHRLFCWLTGTPFPLIRVNFRYPAPAHRDEYHYLFRCEYRFDQAHYEMIFDRRTLQLPIVRSRDELEGFLQGLSYQVLQMPAEDSSYTAKIRYYLKKSLPALPSYSAVAASLELTPQTLRRRLAQEGCDFRQLKNEFLRDTAISLLQGGDKEVSRIADELGFSEPSAFIRAFKSWTGTTPGDYRQSTLT